MIKDVESYVEGLAQEAAANAYDHFHRRFRALRNIVESPIEQALAAAFLKNQGFGGLSVNVVEKLGEETRLVWPPRSMWSIDFWFKPYAGTAATEIMILPQCTVYDRHRVDFLLIIRPPEGRTGYLLLVIECDGHDFHERTKEQARADKSRDRWFISQGIKVLRFTGSEIWANPEKCAEEALDLAYRLWSGEAS